MSAIILRNPYDNPYSKNESPIYWWGPYDDGLAHANDAFNFGVGALFEITRKTHKNHAYLCGRTTQCASSPGGRPKCKTCLKLALKVEKAYKARLAAIQKVMEKMERELAGELVKVIRKFPA